MFISIMTMLHRAISKLKTVPDNLLIDGTHFKIYKDEDGIVIPHQTIKGGDNKFRKLVTVKSNLCAPMWISNRIYFISDHEGIGNIYSSNKLGKDITKHTAHKTYYVRNASAYSNKIVYHAGGDLYMLDVKKTESYKLDFQYNSTKDVWVASSVYTGMSNFDVRDSANL